MDTFVQVFQSQCGMTENGYITQVTFLPRNFKKKQTLDLRFREINKQLHRMT